MESNSSQPLTPLTPAGGFNSSQWNGIPSKVVAKTGDLGIKQIKKETSINDYGQIAFVGGGFEEAWNVITHVAKDGLKTNVKQDHVFSYDNEKNQLRDLAPNVILATAANPEYGIAYPNAINALTPLIKNPARTFDVFKTSYISPGFDASDRSSGIQINNNGDILVRRLEVSSGWTFLGLKEDFAVYPFHYWTPEPNKYASFVETWSANNSSDFQSPKLVSQGFITSYLYPDTYSPIPRLPLIPLRTYEPDFAAHANNASINNKGDIVFRAFGPDNWIAIHDPNNPIIRPQNKDPDMLKVKVPNLGFNVWSSDDDLFIRSSQTSIEVFDKSFKFTQISDSSFTRTGNKARISDDGNVIAFYGERMRSLPPGVQGPPELEKGIYIAIRRKKPDTWEVINVVRAGDEIINFEPDSPVGVATRSFTDESGTEILGATVVYTASTSEGEKLFSNRISFDLKEDFSGPASYEHVHKSKVIAFGSDDIEIYDPINSKGQISYWAKKGGEESVHLSDGGYDIDVRFSDPKDYSSEVKQSIFDAVDRLESCIVGDLPSTEGVDDILINIMRNDHYVSKPPLRVAQGGPLKSRPIGDLPYEAWVLVSYYVVNDEPLKLLEHPEFDKSAALHEIVHALGFVGPLSKVNIVESLDDKRLIASGNALARYREIFGNDDALLPVYGDADGAHWFNDDIIYRYPGQDSYKTARGLRNELMTPFATGNPQPISKVTLGLMQDLGYVVDYSKADPFSSRTNEGTASFAITGILAIGNTITVNAGTPDPNGNGTFSYSWQSSADGSMWNSAGADKSSYLISSADQGKQLRLEVTYEDGDGYSERVTVSIGGVLSANMGTAGFSILGNPSAGKARSVQIIREDPDGSGVFSYAWETSTDGIAWNSVGSGSSYTTAATDQGKQLRVRVSYTDALGNPESVNLSAGPVLPPLVEERVVGMQKTRITELPTPELATDVSLRQGGDDRPLRAIGVDASSIDLGGRQSDQHNTVTVKAAVDSTTAEAQAIGLDGSDLLLRPGDDTLLVEASSTGAGPGDSIAVRNSFLSGNRGNDTLTLRGDYWGDRAIVFGGDGNDRITGHGIGRDSFIQAGSGDDWVSLGQLETTPGAVPLVARDGRSLLVSTYRGGEGFDVLQLRDTSQAVFDAQATWFTTAVESGWLFQGVRFSGFERIVFG